MRKNVLILLLALIASSFCFGQQDFWRKRFTPSTSRYLAVDSKGCLYIATSHGLYVMKDTDSDIVKTNLSYQNIIRVEVNDRDDVFAIPLNEDKLYYSQDGGDTWTVTQLPPSKSETPYTSDQSIKSLDDSNIQSFFAKGDKIICGGANIGGIWKSDNLGVSWSKVWDAPFFTLGVNVIYERNNGDLLAGTSSIIINKTNKNSNSSLSEDYGIFRSTDGGSSWNYWVPNVGRPDFVFDIVENSKTHLFLGTSFYFPDLNGIYVSSDDGVTWQQTLHDPCGWNVDFAIAPNDVIYAFFDGSSPIYRSLVRSFDGGLSWRRIYYTIDGLLNERLLSLCVSPDGYLYALSPSYLLRSAYPVTGPTCTASVSIVPADAGVIAGSGSYHENETVALIAEPFAGFEFVSWSLADGTVLSVNKEYSFQITEDINIIANFRDNSAINELAGKGVKIYPNPFTDYIQIDIDNASFSSGKEINVSVFDMLGRELYRTATKDGKINLSHISNGVYNMSVVIDGKREVYKIVK